MTYVDPGEIIVPAGTARAILLDADSRFSIVNTEGGQVGDLFAFSAENNSEFASASHTRSIIRKIFPRPADQIYTNYRRPILRLEEDHSPGRHDTQYAACDPMRYQMFGVATPHRSCATNLIEVMTEFGGLTVPVPQPFNIFMEVDIDKDGNLSVQPATSQPGDYLVFRTLISTILVLSSCPMDVYEISSGGISPLSIKLL